MDKKTKLYIGIGLLGVGAYLYFRSTKNMVGMVGFTEKRLPCPPGMTMMNGRCVTNSTIAKVAPPIKKPQPSPTFPQYSI